MSTIIVLIAVFVILFTIDTAQKEGEYSRYLEDIPMGDREYHRRRE